MFRRPLIQHDRIHDAFPYSRQLPTIPQQGGHLVSQARCAVKHLAEFLSKHGSCLCCNWMHKSFGTHIKEP